MLGYKQLGFVIMLFSLITMVVGGVYVKQTESFILSQARFDEQGNCIHEPNTICPYEQINRLSLPKYLGSFVLVVFFSIGMYLFFKKRPEEIVAASARNAAKELGGDELALYNLLKDSNGMLFQNELVDKLQMSKVKITRLLDKLEAKGLVERRRRGMTNVVILKHQVQSF
ncbi:MAG: MarR family transcriptional regulator [Candidatus Woesearchaeota archaeon]